MRVSTCCGCCSVSMGVLTIGRLTVVCSALAIMINAVRGISIVAAYVPYVVHLLCGGSLIVAVKTRKSKYNLPMLSMLIVSLISTIPLRVVHFIEKSVLDGESVGFCVQVLFLVGLGVAWLVYLYTVVNSFYEELLREEYTDTKVDGNVNVNLSDKPHLQPV